MANIFQRAVTGATGKKAPNITLEKQGTKLDIPFDLNELFSLKYEFQPLKECIEYIFGQLKKNADQTHSVDTKLVSKFMAFEQ